MEKKKKKEKTPVSSSKARTRFRLFYSKVDVATKKNCVHMHINVPLSTSPGLQLLILLYILTAGIWRFSLISGLAGGLLLDSSEKYGEPKNETRQNPFLTLGPKSDLVLRSSNSF